MRIQGTRVTDERAYEMAHAYSLQNNRSTKFYEGVPNKHVQGYFPITLRPS